MALGVQVDMATPSLAKYGTAEQREIPQACAAGTNVCSIAVSEPDRALTLLALELELFVMVTSG